MRRIIKKGWRESVGWLSSVRPLAQCSRSDFGFIYCILLVYIHVCKEKRRRAHALAAMKLRSRASAAAVASWKKGLVFYAQPELKESDERNEGEYDGTEWRDKATVWATGKSREPASKAAPRLCGVSRVGQPGQHRQRRHCCFSFSLFAFFSFPILLVRSFVRSFVRRRRRCCCFCFARCVYNPKEREREREAGRQAGWQAMGILYVADRRTSLELDLLFCSFLSRPTQKIRIKKTNKWSLLLLVVVLIMKEGERDIMNYVARNFLLRRRYNY